MPRELEEGERIERNPIPVGEYVVTLTAIKDHEGPNTFEPKVLNESTGQMEYMLRREFIWQYEADVVDPQTQRKYEYAVWTPRFYNPTSAVNKLTLLMKMLAPDATPDEHRALIQGDTLIGKRWKVRIITATSKNGKAYQTHLYFIPLDAAAPQAAPQATGKPIPDSAVNVLIDEGKHASAENKAAFQKFIADCGYENWAAFIQNGAGDAPAALLVIRGTASTPKAFDPDEIPF